MRSGFGGELLRVFGSTAPDADLFEVANAGERAQVRARLHSAAENGERFCSEEGKEIDRNRRYGRSPHLGDQTAIHYRQRLAGLGAEELNHCVMGVLLERLRFRDRR